MKIELQNEHGAYTIELKEEVIVLDDYIQLLIIPLLLAAGFQQRTIEEYMKLT
jgi:hypothetical protein